MISITGGTVALIGLSITGGNSGLGLAAATQLAEAGATVVLGVRDAAKGDAAKESIRKITDKGAVEVSPLDLGDLARAPALSQHWVAGKGFPPWMATAG